MDHITKVKGVLFSPIAAEEVVRSFPELDGEFEIEVEKRGDLDHIRLRVEVPGGQSAAQRDELMKRLGSALRHKTQLNFELQPAQMGTLPRYALKAKRFHDRRKEG